MTPHTIMTRATPSPVYDTYWRFAAERQQIFFRRLFSAPPPWTDDWILRRHKFTNAYRASDRVSQFLIRHVIYEGDPNASEVVFRTLLFKLFNKIETWQRLKSGLGDIRYSAYEFGEYDRILTRAIEAGERIYSAAYIMPAAPRAPGESRKHRSHLRLLESMMASNLTDRLIAAPSMRAAFELLRSFPSIGNFLAYQFTTDINYSEVTNFSESEFVMPGPGARDGIRKCFLSLGGFSEADLIKYVTEQQEREFARLGLSFRSLWGRPLQYIDCQNLFCEVDKYARLFHPEVKGITGRSRIKQQFAPIGTTLSAWYPPKWGINGLIETSSTVPGEVLGTDGLHHGSSLYRTDG